MTRPTSTLRRRLVLTPLASALGVPMATPLLGGCATTSGAPAPATPAAEPLLAPPAALHLRHVPPVPRRLAEAVERYTDFAGHSLVDWHPQRPELLLLHRPSGGNVAQLMRVAGPVNGQPATPEALTDGAEPVAEARYRPGDGRYLLFARASGGNEAYQLWRLDLPSRATTQLTDPDQRHAFQAWLPAAGPGAATEAIVASVPLDRTAQGGRREQPTTRLWQLDPEQPQQRRDIAELPGTGWDVSAVSRDGRQAALMRYRSATESELWLLDLASGQRRQLLPDPAAAAGGSRGGAAVHRPLDFSPDGRQLYLLSDRAGEFRELWRLTLPEGPAGLARLTAHLPWDVDDAELSPDGRRLALRVNVDGRDELRLVDAASGRELALPAVPPGSVTALKFHPASGTLAVAVNNAQGPSQVFTLGSEANAPAQPWTRARLHPALDVAALTEPQIVRWTSFDGRRISGLLNRPPARFTGRRPVLVSIHGGPEGQAKVGYAGRNNHLLQELGIAVLQPNVRGSSGYGKTFLQLDNGRLREDSVRDIGALLDWIATQSDLDPQRVVVAGGSYGGYMSLAVATHYADRIAGAIDVVGISHFVTFLESTESYRRDLRRVEYGDERDPAMREFLHRISPLTNAGRIRKPLLVVQGANDPRVPVGEAEQIVARVQANGTPVWYIRAANEGHGFARKENADYQFYATVLFLRQVLQLTT